ncbi:uncharacterized protein DUF1870 [Hephaestia caeni]|uniref:Uncharacterized protein DUF1870 n=2 Tax=Hephaestia caeni TaxID=645617 RepID=A0A397NQJ0_9SPHN|nr:uncharacterized protein DUF1870 [Hephaestia caeni]
MTPAEFDTRRRALGLSIEEARFVCAHNGKPVDVRQVRRWANGESPVAQNAIDGLNALEWRMEAMVNQLVETVTKRTMAGPVPLRRYRDQDDLDRSPEGGDLPLGAHAIYVGWAADALAAEGVGVNIVWADAVD